MHVIDLINFQDFSYDGSDHALSHKELSILSS